jgi:Ca2+:H+ antiporter
VIRTALLTGVVLAFVVAGGVLHFADANAVAVFVVTGAALGGVAWTIGIATESVGARYGPAVTGALQSTLGNLPELFIVLFALAAGEIVVAQFAILGSLFANALLVLGLAIAVGALRSPGGIMRFAPRLPNDTATLLLLAAFIIALLGASNLAGDAASDNQVAISVVGAVLLLAVYGAWPTSGPRCRRSERSRSPRTTCCPSRSQSVSWPGRGCPLLSSPTGSSRRSTLPSSSSGSRGRSPVS